MDMLPYKSGAESINALLGGRVHATSEASSVVVSFGKKAGPANLNSPMRVDTAPEGEDIARENWSKHDDKPRRTHSAASKAKVALAAVPSAKTLAESARQHDVHSDQITDWMNQLLAKAADVFGGELERTSRQPT